VAFNVGVICVEQVDPSRSPIDHSQDVPDIGVGQKSVHLLRLELRLLPLVRLSILEVCNPERNRSSDQTTESKPIPFDLEIEITHGEFMLLDLEFLVALSDLAAVFRRFSPDRQRWLAEQPQSRCEYQVLK
jgi:hypothetical protein